MVICLVASEQNRKFITSAPRSPGSYFEATQQPLKTAALSLVFLRCACAMDAASKFVSVPNPAAARALLIGDRIDTVGQEYDRALSRTPLAFTAGTSGVVTLFRYGVVVMIGLTPSEQEKFLQSIRPRVKGEFTIRDEETAVIELSASDEDHIAPGGPICVKAMSPEHLLVISDALAK